MLIRNSVDIFTADRKLVAATQDRCAADRILAHNNFMQPTHPNIAHITL